MSNYRKTELPFRPRARLLLLLGDQLIRDPGIAVLELVKNAYDADSPNAKVIMKEFDNLEKGKIIIEDAGTGMDFRTITEVWLEPGTDYRADQQIIKQRTEIYNRLPLGEKGVGRFAAHKLGNIIKLTSRMQGKPEIFVEINWDEFNEPYDNEKKQKKYLADIPITIEERPPQYFKEEKTGTHIEIVGLRNVWSRRMVRDLARSVNSICSPFDQEGDFKVDLELPGNEDLLKGLLKIVDVLDFSLFRANCTLTGRKLSYNYNFIPYSEMEKVRSRTSKFNGKNALDLPVDLSIHKIGKVNLDLYIFDREPRILALGVTDKKGLQNFLDINGGVRVYRDGIRVYDYGEPDNDWLGLGGRRVNVPAKRISNNIIIGAVSLDHGQSQSLIEKTNREGFVDNVAFQSLKEDIEFSIKQIEAERNKDKNRIRLAYSSKKVKEPVLEDLSELREIISDKGLEEELGIYIDRIEADFVLIRDRYLLSASSGLSLSVVIHEVEKSIDELAHAVITENASIRVKNLARHIAELIEGFAALYKKTGNRVEKASNMISRALFNTELRLKYHKISVTNYSDQSDFESKCSRRLTISTIMNLIDNSIWWVDNKWGDVEGKKRIFIGTSNEFSKGPAIVIADNGPGFQDPYEYLIEPFISRKPDGMGLGLHIADQVMKTQGGWLVFPDKKEITLPRGFNGAIVALVFKEG